MESKSSLWTTVIYDDYTLSDAWDYIKTTTAYGDFKIWHLVLFLILGPMLNWPMLILLLVMVFNTQTTNLFKGVKSSTSSNG